MPVDDPLFQVMDEELSRFEQLRAQYEGRGTGRAGGLGKHGSGGGAGGAGGVGHRSGTPVALPGMGGRPGVPPPPGSAPGPGGGARGGADPDAAEAERIALQVMLDDQDNFIRNIFGKHAKLGWKKKRHPVQDGAKEALKAARKLEGEAKGLSSDRRDKASRPEPGTDGSDDLSASEVREISTPDENALGKSVFRMVGGLDPKELKELSPLITEISSDLFTDLGSSMVPLVGTGKAGVRMVGKWVGTARRQKHVFDTREAREKVVPGDPEAAVAAVQRLLERERNRRAEEATVETAKFAFDAAEFAVDFGVAGNAVSSMAAVLAKLAIQIHELIRDSREMKLGRQVLHGGKLNADMFNQCPILGAYAVTSSNTSALVGFLGGAHHLGSMDRNRLEGIIRKYEKPLQERATELIAASRMEVTGLPTDLAQARLRHYRKRQKTLATRLKQLAARAGKAAG